MSTQTSPGSRIGESSGGTGQPVPQNISLNGKAVVKNSVPAKPGPDGTGGAPAGKTVQSAGPGNTAPDCPVQPGTTADKTSGPTDGPAAPPGRTGTPAAGAALTAGNPETGSGVSGTAKIMQNTCHKNGQRPPVSGGGTSLSAASGGDSAGKQPEGVKTPVEAVQLRAPLSGNTAPGNAASVSGKTSGTAGTSVPGKITPAPGKTAPGTTGAPVPGNTTSVSGDNAPEITGAPVPGKAPGTAGTPAPGKAPGAAGTPAPGNPAPVPGNTAPAPAEAAQPPASPPKDMGTLAPAEVDFMPPLLRSLATLLRLRGKGVSPQFLLAGLSGEQNVTPGACLRSAERAGLSGRILYREKITEISVLTLPCILLLGHDRSCVLTRLDKDTAEVIFPENGEQPQTVPLEPLQQDYIGYTLFGNLTAQLDQRVSKLSVQHTKRWFWDVLRHYVPIYRHVAFASIFINLIGICTPLFVMNVYDRVVPNAAFETLWVLTCGVLIAYAFDFLLRTLRSYFVDVAGRNADVVLSSNLVNKVLSMRMDAKPESTGALVNNVREFESLREFFSSSTLLACIDIPFLAIFLLLILFIGGPLVILPLTAIPILIVVGLLLQKAAKRSSEESYKQNMQKNALLVEMVHGLETLKVCMAESRMQRLWESVVGVSAKSSNEARKYNNMAITISMLLTQLVSVTMVVWGVYRISDGLLTMGGLIGCNILVGRAMAPLMQVASLLTRFQNSRMSLNSLNMLINLPSESGEENACVDFGSLAPSFAMEHISFHYPNAKRAALNDVSFTIRAGERVGIIGRMGSGKSTIGRLLAGLYQPTEGAVKFGNVDIRQLNTPDLRGRIGFLPQDVVLFYGSVRDNIVLGDPCINDQVLLRAASLAGVTEFIRTNPAGFGAQVGEQGRALSGGQRQAVGLARALVRDPDVIILDEPTSNMDTASEIGVQRRLMHAMAHKTLILITHRLSMLAVVDRLIVVENGCILLDGPKDAVLQQLRHRQSPIKASANKGGSNNAAHSG